MHVHAGCLFVCLLSRRANNICTSNQPSQEDALYSVLDHSGRTRPHTLPPDRVPYYQEIESDRTPPAPYETPVPMPQSKPYPAQAEHEKGDIIIAAVGYNDALVDPHYRDWRGGALIRTLGCTEAA